MSSIREVSDRKVQRVRALEIRRTLGVRRAAAYLRNCGWSLEGARAFLLRR